ncbi:hypothetical protein GCM10011491_09260 [Brucella endophytica]|uniref:Lipoprotein n=1 Tax=Brucella endophytica TaxID=1963359 RepID=A0A916WAX9_9HYPH|nr:hypothetical protein [Brucella endophytica]GGA83957.1 hypothetical protein GCM10011491_09260 [Brucella endophytica]
MHKLAAIGLLSVVLAGCQTQPPSPASAPAPTGNFDAAFAQAVPLCERFFLPNAQARKPGVNLDKELARTDARIKAISTGFKSAEGRRFLQEKIRTEKDDVAKACAEKLLG